MAGVDVNTRDYTGHLPVLCTASAGQGDEIFSVLMAGEQIYKILYLVTEKFHWLMLHFPIKSTLANSRWHRAYK